MVAALVVITEVLSTGVTEVRVTEPEDQMT